MALAVEEKKEKVLSEREKVEVEMKRWEKQQQRKARQVISFAFGQQEGEAGHRAAEYKRVFACIPCRKGFESKKKLDWHRRKKHVVRKSRTPQYLLSLFRSKRSSKHRSQALGRVSPRRRLEDSIFSVNRFILKIFKHA